MSLVSVAYAETTKAVQEPMASAGITSFIPLILIFCVFYFLLIRPQVKRQKEHQKLLSELKKGDKVITSAGIIGIINKIDETEKVVHLEIAPEVKIKVIRSSINELYNHQIKEAKQEEK